jgi:hypothetical protein
MAAKAYTYFTAGPTCPLHNSTYGAFVQRSEGKAWKNRSASGLPYFKPSCPRRCFTETPTVQESGTPTAQQRWIQYSRSIKSAATQLGSYIPVVVHKPPCKQSTRKLHRTAKLKLRKLSNIILLCRIKCPRQNVRPWRLASRWNFRRRAAASEYSIQKER